jgi:hypothetical protein
MVENPMPGQTNDDPRKLSAMVAHAAELAESHEVGSVLMGLKAETGDRRLPDYVNYLQSSLRVEDRIFRMTRERTVVLLADCSVEKAEKILSRLMGEFMDEFPNLTEPRFEQRFVEVKPDGEPPKVKDVLTQVFAPRFLH